MQEDKEVRVRDRARAGGAQETKMSAEQKDLQGPSQEEAQKIRDEVGLAPQEVEKINKSKSVQADQGVALNSRVEKAVNVAAALTTAVAGVGLIAVAQDALKNTPPAIVAGETDPSRDNPSSSLRTSPPAGVVFPENGPFGSFDQAQDKYAQDKFAQGKRADGSVDSPQGAPATEVKPFGDAQGKPTRIFIPMVAKDFREPETPLYLREFGAPERGVTMRNKVEQGGGNLAYVEMGDQELWNNLMYLRDTYGAKDEEGKPLKLEITYYSSLDLLLRDPQAPPYRQENRRGAVLNYDIWAGGNGTFQNGSTLFQYTEDNKTLRFYITLPETNRGKVPTEDELNRLHADFVFYLREYIFLAREDGRSNLSLEQWNNPAVYQDLLAHPVIAQDSTRRVVNSSVWIKLETVPTTGGK